MAVFYMTPTGVPTMALGQGSSANYQASRPAGDQGKGWNIAYDVTNGTTPSADVTDILMLPSNARGVSITYSMNALSSRSMTIQACNCSQDSIKAGNGIFGPYLTTVAPVITGGSADSNAVTITIPAPPQAIRAVLSGAGGAAGDTIKIRMTCVTTIRP